MKTNLNPPKALEAGLNVEMPGIGPRYFGGRCESQGKFRIKGLRVEGL